MTVTVLLSIIIAVAVSEILAGIGRLIRERNRVKFYGTHIAGMVLALLTMILHWWGIWQYRTVEFRAFHQFLALLAPSLTLVIVAFLITPRLPFQGQLDLRDYYFRNQRWTFGLAAVILVEFILLSVAIGDRSVLHSDNGIRALGVGILVGLAFVRDARVHTLSFVVLYLLILFFYARVQL